MDTFANAISTARRRAGLSQAALAERADTSQPAIARLERGDGNPTLATFERTLAAAGFRLRLELEPVADEDPVIGAYKRDVDRTLLRANLRRSLDERIRMNADAVALGTELARATAARRRAR